ncbi:MAG: DUF885 family protein [Fimbriimonadaceae bacterium]|nr:DUF885 family protein [Fimbriimonadaceae bacterium]QYK56016.1 MAG: DUF885 family protein [Fimbriimonadaceae bacterium]
MLGFAAVAAFATMASQPQQTWPERIILYTEDIGSLSRKYDESLSPTGVDRMERFYRTVEKEAQAAPAETRDDKVDKALLTLDAAKRAKRLAIEAGQNEATPHLPFRATIVAFDDARRDIEPVRPKEAAKALAQIPEMVADARRGALNSPPSRAVALRASRMTAQLGRALERWFKFYDGYDPQFSWWCRAPYAEAKEAVDGYEKFLREEVGGVRLGDQTTIVGDPIGRDALLAELQLELIPYTPEELVEIAWREYEWCLKEMKRASSEMGYGDDWHRALEAVKGMHEEPGGQPQFIKGLADEAATYVRDHGLVTVPELAAETWRMEMMSAERQLASPFFLGGEAIIVSFPTESMPEGAKQMSMRGNNRHFARAVAHHELIPGHHLQQFMTQRYRPYRQVFSTPFWIEGWALYWEFVLYDMGFARSPEDRIGMLFWRMHRCVRVEFSLGFHLGKLTPDQCVEMLVDRVGHEPANAEAEVRRSFGGDYPPLYQAAYLLGGLQMKALAAEALAKGMTLRQFHDEVLRQGPIPIPILRMALGLGDSPAGWKFAQAQL